MMSGDNCAAGESENTRDDCATYTYPCNVFCFSYKGDHVAITEETLDQQFYIVVNQRSDSRGKVPVEYVRISESCVCTQH